MPPNIALPDLSFLESVEKGHAALDTNERVAARLGVRAPPVRMDSQAKYGALARGDSGAGVYLRLPIAGANYQEKIWVRPVSWNLFFVASPSPAPPFFFLVNSQHVSFLPFSRYN